MSRFISTGTTRDFSLSGTQRLLIGSLSAAQKRCIVVGLGAAATAPVLAQPVLSYRPAELPEAYLRHHIDWTRIEKRYNDLRQGVWHYCPEDFTLNLITEHKVNGCKSKDTLEKPFYWFYLNEVNSYQDIFEWVGHLAGKNIELYGTTCVIDLSKMFKHILRVAKKEKFIPKNAESWSGQDLAEKYSKYVRKKKKSSISKSLRIDVLARDKYTCQTCGAKAPDVKLHIDHKFPKSKGGSDDISNLWVLCEACNIGKSDKILDLSR